MRLKTVLLLTIFQFLEVCRGQRPRPSILNPGQLRPINSPDNSNQQPNPNDQPIDDLPPFTNPLTNRTPEDSFPTIGGRPAIRPMNINDKSNCMDDWPRCPVWAKTYDLCQSDSWGSWMQMNCKDSCGQCLKKCVDLWPGKDFCDLWNDWELCTDARWKTWMERNCKDTCKKCPETPELPKVCGVTPQNRIVGGIQAEPNSIPWQGALILKEGSRPFCGGTIICARFIMTAAHCMTIPAEDFVVLAGEHDLMVNMDFATSHEVEKINNHPEYNSRPWDYDFSILKLKDSIALTGDSKARAVCLPEGGDTSFSAGTEFVVSGWGTLSQSGMQPDQLHFVSVPWITDAVCQNAYNDINIITDRMICAGDIDNGGIDSCQGDSGGPLTWIDSNTDTVKLIGVVSWGIGCASAGRPGVYAELTSVLPWIKEMVGSCSNGLVTPDILARPACGMLEWVGDGYCDDDNNEGCDWDGGDCCNNAQQGWDRLCTECFCSDAATSNSTDCEDKLVGDGYCDDPNNHQECQWDGGDCCNNDEEGWDKYCNECECLDPNEVRVQARKMRLIKSMTSIDDEKSVRGRNFGETDQKYDPKDEKIGETNKGPNMVGRAQNKAANWFNSNRRPETPDMDMELQLLNKMGIQKRGVQELNLDYF